jgi:predicted permease
MFTRLTAAVRALLTRRRAHREADEELQFHLEHEIAANLARGMTGEEARRVALRDLGGLTQTREAVREVRASWGEGLLQDLRYSCASLRRSPVFTATAIGVLALAIAVTSGAFAIVNAVFFRDRGVAQPADLVHIYQVLPRYGQTAILGEPYIELFGRSSDVFEGLAGYWAIPMSVARAGTFGLLQGELVTPNYFDVLGVRPILGRTFGPAEGDPATTEFAAVISHDLWIREFSAAQDVIGRHLEVGSDHDEPRTFTIVGVAAEHFRGLSSPWNPTRFWVPVRQYWGTTRPGIGLGVVGRLQEGVTAEPALAALAVPYQQWWSDRMKASSGFVRAPGAPVRQGPNPLRILPFDDVRIPLDPDAEIIPRRLALGVALVVALVLAVAVANIAGIMRARGLSRMGELAVRRALGAGLWRTVRQLTVESLLLSLAAGAVGLLLGIWLVAFYRAFTPDRLLVPVTIDVPVVVFTLVLAAGVAIIVALVPALQAVKVNVVAAFAGGPGTTPRTRSRLRHGIVVPQIAVTALLLVAALVHVRALAAVEAVDTGYRVDEIHILRVGLQSKLLWTPGTPPSASAREREAERARGFYTLLAQRLDAVPGVRAAAVASDLPTRDRGSGDQPAEYVARDSGGPTGGALASSMEVSAGYFQTLGIPLIGGRDFEASDIRGAEPVGIVSRAVERQLWPNGSAIGKSIAVVRDDGQFNWLTVVGVAGDVSPTLRPDSATPMVYVPLLQQWWPSGWNVLLDVGDSDAAAVAATLRAEVTALDPQTDVYSARSLRSLVDEQLYPRRAAATLLLLCGVVGLVLAGIGLYAVVSYSIVLRLREMAIRVAIGATGRDVARLVLREAAVVATIGLFVGLPASVSALRFASSLLTTVRTWDPLVFVVVSGIIAAMTAGACAVSARRASAVDPVSLLRNG